MLASRMEWKKGRWSSRCKDGVNAPVTCMRAGGRDLREVDRAIEDEERFSGSMYGGLKYFPSLYNGSKFQEFGRLGIRGSREMK